MSKLIVNGDDFGMTKGVNKGILEAAKLETSFQTLLNIWNSSRGGSV